MTTLDWALRYFGLNWSIIPIEPGTKKPPPGIRWKPYQTRRADDAQVREWFGKGADLGIAVIFGEVSGGLVCRDFDRMDAYDAWAKRHPALAATLPTAATSRGGTFTAAGMHRRFEQ